MTVSTQAPELQQVMVLQPIRKHLLFAQDRLLDPNIPFQLRALSYLRICSTAIRTYQRLELLAPSLDSKTPYLTLLGDLTNQHPEWWRFCEIADRGYLISSDRTINRILQPLNAFVALLLDLSQVT